MYSQGLSHSPVITKEKNSEVQCKPTEAFPGENWGGDSIRCVSIKSSRDPSPVKILIKLGDSDEECDLVIDAPPERVTKKKRTENYTGRKSNEGLASVDCAKELHRGALADLPKHTEEISEKTVILQKNSRSLNTPGTLYSGSKEGDKIYLPSINTCTLKALKERDALACGEKKSISLATSVKENMNKGIWKQGNEQTKTIVHTSANEDFESSSRVTQSVLYTSNSSTERLYMKIKTEESQRIEENEDDDSQEDKYIEHSYSLSNKASKITLSSPRGHSTEDSESDDPLEECLRIFEEFKKEKQKEACDEQAHREKVLGTEGIVPEQKTSAACSAKLAIFEVCNKNGMVSVKAPSQQKSHHAEFQQEHHEFADAAKNGQAFIARTFEEKQIASGLSAAQFKKTEPKAFTGSVLYELLKDYILTKEQLNENNFPRPNPEKSGSAILPKVVKGPAHDALKRTCCRCGIVYAVSSSGEHKREEECNYHSGRIVEQKVPGGVEKHYSCCERSVGSAGCQIAKLHVHNGRSNNMEGFVKTFAKYLPREGTFGVYALDCEMCYTTHGLELTRVAVVDAMLRVVYDTFVKPDGKIVDYDRRLSGVTEDDLKNTRTSLQNVQAVLLSLFSADTILIGHKLEKSFIALKLIHDTVVDTSILFPHHLGLPNKRTHQNLIAEYLRRIHQDDDVNGHNSKEEATACMELILWKVKEDNKKIKWL